MKPDFSSSVRPRERIIAQLEARNSLGLRLVYPEQGMRIDLQGSYLLNFVHGQPESRSVKAIIDQDS